MTQKTILYHEGLTVAFKPYNTVWQKNLCIEKYLAVPRQDLTVLNTIGSDHTLPDPAYKTTGSDRMLPDQTIHDQNHRTWPKLIIHDWNLVAYYRPYMTGSADYDPIWLYLNKSCCTWPDSIVHDWNWPQLWSTILKWTFFFMAGKSECYLTMPEV